MSNPYTRHNEKNKANFDGVYDLPDPRAYFTALGSLDYRAPEHGRRVFEALLGELPGAGESPSKVLDLCCSYGVNAALLRHDLTLDDLYARYAADDLSELSSEELAAADSKFYAQRISDKAPPVIGVDVAENAVLYALRVGLLSGGAATNLEKDEPPEDFRQAAENTNLITVTGGVGYIWERTFSRVLSLCTDPDGTAPWVAAFAVRFVDYAPIAGALARRGLITEKLSLRTFPQRRFEDAAERDHVLKELAARNIDPAGREETGWYHADLYLSRPAREVRERPADELLGDSGALDY